MRELNKKYVIKINIVSVLIFYLPTAVSFFFLTDLIPIEKKFSIQLMLSAVFAGMVVGLIFFLLHKSSLERGLKTGDFFKVLGVAKYKKMIYISEGHSYEDTTQTNEIILYESARGVGVLRSSRPGINSDPVVVGFHYEVNEKNSYFHPQIEESSSSETKPPTLEKVFVVLHHNTQLLHKFGVGTQVVYRYLDEKKKRIFYLSRSIDEVISFEKNSRYFLQTDGTYKKLSS